MDKHELHGCFDIVYSPDDDGFYADLLWARDIDSPIFNNRSDAEDWARASGGDRLLRG